MIRIMMEISVRNASKSSISDTRIALQLRDYLVGETITQRRYKAVEPRGLRSR